MAKLSLKTQGTKGGNPTWKEKIGYSANFIDNQNDIIIIDAYRGQGKEYAERLVCNIEIHNNNDIIFEGSFEELCNKLKN